MYGTEWKIPLEILIGIVYNTKRAQYIVVKNNIDTNILKGRKERGKQSWFQTFGNEMAESRILRGKKL